MKQILDSDASSDSDFDDYGEEYFEENEFFDDNDYTPKDGTTGGENTGRSTNKGLGFVRKSTFNSQT